MAVLVGIALLTLTGVSTPAAEPQGFESYVVRPGDTLGKIAVRIFGSGKRWREILKANPQITNANLIFPGDILQVPLVPTATSTAETGEQLSARSGGDTVQMPPPEVAPDQHSDVAASGAGKPAGGSEPKKIAVPTAPPPLVEVVRPVPVVNPVLYRSAGIIAERLPELAIVASVDNRAMLATGDAAIVNAPVTPGQRFTVVRADRRVFHPQTGAYLGWLTRVLGTAEVTCRDERTSTIALRGMRDAGGIGDYLVPFDPNDTLKENTLAGQAKPDCIPAGAADGVIVAFDEDRLAAAEQDFAYIDRGTAEGVNPGHRLTIYREIQPEGRIMVGEIQVLRAAKHTATALITTSVQEVKIGDLLRRR